MVLNFGCKDKLQARRWMDPGCSRERGGKVKGVEGVG